MRLRVIDRLAGDELSPSGNELFICVSVLRVQLPPHLEPSSILHRGVIRVETRDPLASFVLCAIAGGTEALPAVLTFPRKSSGKIAFCG